MKNTLYLECYGGISGDMTVAALLDLGANKEVLLNALNSLCVSGYKIEIGRVIKSGLDACDFNVILDSETDNPIEMQNHHHSHLPDHVSEHGHSHEHSIEQEHSPNISVENGMEHAHSHTHEKVIEKIKLGTHDHRNLYDINKIIESAAITEHAKETALKIFRIVAEAEAKAHGLPIREVHFHEVGAVDSIVDIVAAAVCLDNLQISDVIVSKLYEGCGHIHCQHGILPVPVPAVSNIVASYHLPMHITSIQGELVTPTGAAIVAAIKTREELPEEFSFQKIGLGAGKRNYENAGILRAMLLEDKHKKEADSKWVLEANIDDCTGETLGIAMELLLENGALDAYFTPIYMKKNRPAYMLSVICEESIISKMEELIFIHTTTIGIRRHSCQRTILSREIMEISTPYGMVKVKKCQYKTYSFYYPEYESVKVLSHSLKTDYSTLYCQIQAYIKTTQS